MPALATLTMVWLGAQTLSAAASASLEGWAETRAVRLERPRRDTVIDGSRSAWQARWERWLEQARDQQQAGDDEAAEASLTELERSLRAHPEALEAGWLMAERYRAGARIVRRRSPEEMRRYEMLADVLEGQRAAAFAEPSTKIGMPVAKIHVELSIHGARRHETAWDGALSGDDFFTAPGEHHLIVFRGAGVAWAGWVSVLAAGKIDVWIPDATACSVEDFDGVAMRDGARIDVPPGVRCASWLAVAPAPSPGTLLLAVCNGDRCEPPKTLYDGMAATRALPERAAPRSFLPAWATWTLAGVGIAATTSIVLWRAGVFETARDSKVIYDGSNL
jgi:hypothetical protein